MKLYLKLGVSGREGTNPTSKQLEILKEPYFKTTPSWAGKTRRSDSLADFDSGTVRYTGDQWEIEGLTTDHPEKVYQILSLLGFSMLESKISRDYNFNPQAEEELNAMLRARGVRV